MSDNPDLEPAGDVRFRIEIEVVSPPQRPIASLLPGVFDFDLRNWLA
jgi:hypothetical protein